MPSQLVKSAKLDSLPDDLKKIADKLIKDKFNIPDEKPQPEIVKRPYPTSQRYRVQVIGMSDRLSSMSMRGMGTSYTSATTVPRPPQYFEITVMDEYGDPRQMAHQLDRAEKQIEAQTGYRVQLVRDA